MITIYDFYMKNTMLLCVSLIFLISEAKADSPECTAIGLAAFTAKNIELSGCGNSGNTSLKGLDLFGNCLLSESVIQKVMLTAKNDVKSMSCSQSKEMYDGLTKTILLLMNHH